MTFGWKLYYRNRSKRTFSRSLYKQSLYFRKRPICDIQEIFLKVRNVLEAVIELYGVRWSKWHLNYSLLKLVKPSYDWSNEKWLDETYA